jgi:hypothetical protein
VPDYLRKSSVYADRGSACHAVMALILGDDGGEEAPPPESFVGWTFNDYTITRDDIENAIRPVWEHVDELLDQPGAEYFLEHRVEFPGIPGAFGTCDLLVRIGDTIYLLD